MSKNRQRDVMKKRSPPRAKIEPICVDELLTAAGMSGFLGVLDPPTPVPHLQQLAGQAARISPSRGASDRNQAHVDSGSVPLWFSSRVEGILGRLAGQQGILSEISEVVGRVNAGAERLNRQATSMYLRHLVTQNHLENGLRAGCRPGPPRKETIQDEEG